MQTFLPYENFAESAKVLDMKRLGKQRVEALQVIQALLPGSTSSWRNHPATKMWRGHESWLHTYALQICDEWIDRGYRDTCRDKIDALVREHFGWETPRPPWLGDSDFHRAHRSNLVRKNAEFYAPKFESDLPDDLPYIWPVQ